MREIPKSCSTCEHRNGAFRRCALSGYFCEVERRYLTRCGKDFEGWKQRLGFFERVKFLLFGAGKP